MKTLTREKSMKINDELWEMNSYEREIIEREEKAIDYIEYCIARRYERILNILMVVGGLVLLSLPLFNI